MSRSDAQSSSSNRGLLALVILLGALIMIGVGALIAGAFLRGGNRPAAAVASGGPYLSALKAPGKRIESTQIDGNRILVRLGGINGEELVVLDAGSGRVIVRVTIDPNP